METQEIFDWFDEKANNQEYVELSGRMLDEMNNDQAVLLAEYFGHSVLVKLPQREIDFFEWLKENDRDVWDDLWEEENEDPYIVGASFIPQLLDRHRGFPVCDLLENDNYYFTDKHIIGKESQLLIDSVRGRFQNKEPLTPAQLLILEISLSPIDIWHFSYKHNISIERAKSAVKELAEEEMLLHLTKAEHLANFVEF